MDFPILVDSLNLLGVAAVPITVGIDAHGIVRRLMRRPTELASFLGEDYPAPRDEAPRPARLDPDVALAHAREADTAEAWHAAARAVFLWGGDRRLDEACRSFEKAAQLSEDPVYLFQLGVALRRKWESEQREPGDFQAAIAAWQAALDTRPSQYIWRRRIQQYGPRLKKPYPFYDWVRQARLDLRARGEDPALLRVEPRGTELAEPAETFESAAEVKNPDPDRKIDRDVDLLARIEATVVPRRVAPGSTARVHLTLRVGEEVPAHWNNEIDELLVWIEPPDGVQVSDRRLTWPNPKEPESDEIRELELEIQVPKKAGRYSLEGYALYAVCRDDDGTCLYRRQEFTVSIEVSETDF